MSPLRELGSRMFSGVLLVSLFAPVPMPRPVSVYLGMEVQSGNGTLKVTGIYLSSPAHDAGLAAADVILRIDGEPVRTATELNALLRKKKPGDVLNFLVRREEREVKVSAKLDAARPWPWLGAVLSETHVEEVLPGSPAQVAGLKASDVILSVDGGKLESGPDLIARLGKKKPGDMVTLLVRRGMEEVKVPLKLGKRPGY